MALASGVPVAAYPVAGPLDVIGGSDVGVLDENLGSAVVQALEIDPERCRTYALSSPSIGTSLNPFIGYEAAARVIKRSMAEGRTLREVVLDEGLLTEDEVDRALRHALDRLLAARQGKHVWSIQSRAMSKMSCEVR